MKIVKTAVITGLGCITPYGVGVDKFWQGISTAQAGIHKHAVTGIPGLSELPLGKVTGYRGTEHFNDKSVRLLDLATQYALVSAREAMQDAELSSANLDPERTGVVLGTGCGLRETNDEVLENFHLGRRTVPPYALAKGLFNAPCSHISIEYGIRGPCYMVTTACASSNHAIGQALQLIQTGAADIVLAGGTEAVLTPPFIQAWRSMRILDFETCRPFSRGRQGLVLGEGAGIVVVEEENHARARGAAAYARLSGFACTADAQDMTRIGTLGPQAAIKQALRSASLNPEDIDYVNAHGTGTVLNDAAETRILKQVFGSHAHKLKISSTKSMHGHALGASAALEFIAVVKAIKHGIIPPTLNYEAPDADCDLNYVANEARTADVAAAISNAFAFGGLNAVVAVTRT